MALTWPLPDPGLILTLRSTEKIFHPTLSSRHCSLPTMCRNPGGGTAPVAYFHEQCGQNPSKNTCDRVEASAWHTDCSGCLPDGKSARARRDGNGLAASPALQEELGGQFESVILYGRLADPPTTDRKLSKCLLCKEGALFSAVTWKWQVFPIPPVTQLFCWLKTQLS